MKKLFLLLTISISLYSCDSSESEYQYMIVDNRGNYFYTNVYNETGNGCILFNDEPGKDDTPGKPTVICGNYSLQSLK